MSKEAGVALTIAGVLAGIGGLALSLSCTRSVFGSCVERAYSGIGVLIAFGGVAVFIVGLVLLAISNPPAPRPPAYAAPPMWYGALPNAPAPAAYPPARTIQSPYACAVCGQGLVWIPSERRWFCYRCNQWRSG